MTMMLNHEIKQDITMLIATFCLNRQSLSAIVTLISYVVAHLHYKKTDRTS